MTSGRPASYSSNTSATGRWKAQQGAFAILRYLLAIAQHDRILAHKIDAADMTVQVDPDARPIQPGRNLLDVSRFAGSMHALNDDAPVLLEAGKYCERGGGIEAIGLVDGRNPGRVLTETPQLAFEGQIKERPPTQSEVRPSRQIFEPEGGHRELEPVHEDGDVIHVLSR